MGIKSKMSRDARFLKWINNYPVPSNKKLAVLRDYLKLYKTRFITPDEYYDFEMEHQDTSFRGSFLGVNEQHYYLDLLNPVKYYIFARNKYAAHKMFEKALRLVILWKLHGIVKYMIQVSTIFQKMGKNRINLPNL